MGVKKRMGTGGGRIAKSEKARKVGGCVWINKLGWAKVGGRIGSWEPGAATRAWSLDAGSSRRPKERYFGSLTEYGV